MLYTDLIETISCHGVPVSQIAAFILGACVVLLRILPLPTNGAWLQLCLELAIGYSPLASSWARLPVDALHSSFSGVVSNFRALWGPVGNATTLKASPTQAATHALGCFTENMKRIYQCAALLFPVVYRVFAWTSRAFFSITFGFVRVQTFPHLHYQVVTDGRFKQEKILMVLIGVILPGYFFYHDVALLSNFLIAAVVGGWVLVERYRLFKPLLGTFHSGPRALRAVASKIPQAMAFCGGNKACLWYRSMVASGAH